MEKQGLIEHLTFQPVFVLAEKVKFPSIKKTKPALRYVADFLYHKDGKRIVEDVKGVQTAAYRIKKHLMMAVHGVEVIEI